MRLDMIVGIQMKQAMDQTGCPICNIRNAFETRYLKNLLREFMNDCDARKQMIASLGYCTKHAWQMGFMERDTFGDAVGNAIMYESLVDVVMTPLVEHQQSVLNRKRQAQFFKRIASRLKSLLGMPEHNAPDPYAPLVLSACRVCQTGENAERNYLEWLLTGLSEPEPELREGYQTSGGLCLQHFRQALSMETGAVESGVRFLITHMLERLPKLREDLREYTGKHAWDRQTEDMILDERRSWMQAIRFFAGNEGNILHSGLGETPNDDRTNDPMRMPQEQASTHAPFRGFHS